MPLLLDKAVEIGITKISNVETDLSEHWVAKTVKISHLFQAVAWESY